MSESDVTIITEWLHSGGQYASYADPTRFLKLLLDEETGRVLSSTLKEKVTPEDPYLPVEQIVDTLEDLVASRKTVNTRRMELFKGYKTPRLMGVNGCNVDGFLAKLSKDVTACKLETFNWKDYKILTCINTLTNDKDEVRLAERLIKVYN